MLETHYLEDIADRLFEFLDLRRDVFVERVDDLAHLLAEPPRLAESLILGYETPGLAELFRKDALDARPLEHTLRYGVDQHVVFAARGQLVGSLAD